MEKNLAMMIQDYKLICARLVLAFCKKQGMEFDYWVNDDYGSVAVVGDYFFNFSDIIEDLKNERKKGEIINWYDVCLDRHYAGKDSQNYYSYCENNYQFFEQNQNL